MPIILAAIAAVFLAVRPAAAQDARLNQISPVLLEVTGGSGANAWRLRYGTFPSHVKLVASASHRVYFSHADTLRAIDDDRGIVIGRWRFPCPIGRLTATANRVQLQLNCSEYPAPPQTPTVDFDPAMPVVPNWPSTLQTSSLPQTEAVRILGEKVGYFDCRSRLPYREQAFTDQLPAIEEAIRRDPLSPWLQLELAKVLRQTSSPRATDVLAAVVDAPATDFRELLSVSACLDNMAEPRLAARVFDRAYADYLARGYDARLFTSEFARMRVYTWLFYGPNGRPGTMPDPVVMERLYQLSPSFPRAEIVWEIYSDILERSGRGDDSRVWRARAHDARVNSLMMGGSAAKSLLDRVLLLTLASIAAAFLLAVSLYIKYIPQRRLVLAARARGRWMPKGFAFFNLEYWSRRERVALVVAALTLWLAVGFGNAYNRVFRQAARPMSSQHGSLGSSAFQWYTEHMLMPSTPERDLLMAIGHQQSGDAEKAERAYRLLPQFAESWNNLGVILENAGRQDEARAAFDRALDLDPHLAEAALNRDGRTEDFWTTLHQRYVPGRPMIAPPRPSQWFRATVGMSPTGIALRASEGPLFDWPRNKVFAFVRVITSDPIILFDFLLINDDFVDRFLTVAAAFVWMLAVIVLFCPAREVTQGSGLVFKGLTYAWPGLSPVWGWAAAPALLASLYLILECVLMLLIGTPGIMSMDSAFWASLYRVPTEQAVAIAFRNPSWWVLAGEVAALWASNAFLIRRASRQRMS